MKMIDHYKQYEPLFGEWRISKLIGKGSFGEVYEIERENFGTLYKAALKAITIPVDESELNEIMSSGMSVSETKQYIRQSAKDIVNEFVLMSKLKGNTNIVSYEDHQVIEHEDQLGWDILMKMELLKPINEYIKENGFTKEDVVKLGIDLCTAIGLCEKYNIVHRDIKPENIFVSPNGDFKLGDFGIARSIERATMGLSKKGTYTYMAPEVYRGESYTEQVDLYSLGIVMYKFMNYNRIPFMPNYPSPVAYSDREQALMKRVNGEKLLPPCGVAEDKLVEIVLKACEYKPENRYKNALEMKEALEALLGKVERQVLINPASKNAEPAKKKEKAKVKKVSRQVLEEDVEKTLLLDREELTHSSPSVNKTGKNYKLWAGIVVGGLIAMTGGAGITAALLKTQTNAPEQMITAEAVQIASTANMQMIEETLSQKLDEAKKAKEKAEAEAKAKAEQAAKIEASKKAKAEKQAKLAAAKKAKEQAKLQAQVTPQTTESISAGQAVLKKIDEAQKQADGAQAKPQQKKETPAQKKPTQKPTQKQAQPKQTQPAQKPTQKQETPKSEGQSGQKDQPPEIYLNFD